MTDIMTKEELDAFEQRLAKEMLEQIKEQMLYKIVSEHSARSRSAVDAIVRKHALGMAEAELDSRKDELREAIKKSVTHYLSVSSNLDSIIHNAIQLRVLEIEEITKKAVVEEITGKLVQEAK